MGWSHKNWIDRSIWQWHSIFTYWKTTPSWWNNTQQACVKTKLNSYGGLDKLEARVCQRGDMKIKDAKKNSWSPTASARLLKYLIADAARNKTFIYQLDFIKAFIQSQLKRRIFDILYKEYGQFCPKLARHFGRPLR